MRTRIPGHLRHTRGGDITRIDRTDRPTFMMHLQHDASRFLHALAEKFLQHLDDEFHRRVVIVEQDDLVQRRRPDLLLRWCGRGHDGSFDTALGGKINANHSCIVGYLTGARCAKEQCGRRIGEEIVIIPVPARPAQATISNPASSPKSAQNVI